MKGNTPNNLLFTGPPGCGKTTLVQRIVTQIRVPKTGFYTQEIREQGRRVGFAIVTLDGHQAVMAHVDIQSPHRVGRYGVDVAAIDHMAVPSLSPQSPDNVIVIDEIGKMELFSNLFRKAVIHVLNSPNPIIGTISLKGGRFIQAIKEQPDVTVVMVSRENRGELFNFWSNQFPDRGKDF
jgi:nucleoside-triphosphatase